MPAGSFREVGPLRTASRSSDNPEMKIDSTDTAWVLAWGALVMLMTPALGYSSAVVFAGWIVLPHSLTVKPLVAREERKPVPVSA